MASDSTTSLSTENAFGENVTGDGGVVMLPDYTTLNPYQSKLADALRDRGNNVVLSSSLLLPVLQAVKNTDSDIVHFHWLHHYILADNPIVMAVKVLQFFMELTVYKLVFDGTVVWTVHNKMEHKKRWPTAERWIKRTFLLYFCDRAIVHCDRGAKAICAEFNLSDDFTDRINVVPHGHYIDVYENRISRTTARGRLGLPDDGRVFVFIGSIRPYKQVPKLIESFKTVDADGTWLVIAGKPWNDSLAAAVRRRCDNRDDIKIRLKTIPESEFQVYLNAADAAVFPFYKDILTSGSVILAMSFGIGVIVPEVGCLPETLSAKGSILYDPSDDMGLMDALRTAVDADLDTMGARNYEKITEFDWEFVAAETANVYEAAKLR